MSHAGPNVVDAFWDHVAKGDGCWEWTAGRGRAGYGAAWSGGRVQYAHRLAWALVNGPIPVGLRVLHHCDNPGCVRPDHLWLGTAKDNSRDMAAKGRMAQQKDPSKIVRGDRHWRRRAAACA